MASMVFSGGGSNGRRGARRGSYSVPDCCPAVHSPIRPGTRTAIRDATSATVRLTNYRRCGESFINSVKERALGGAVLQSLSSGAPLMEISPTGELVNYLADPHTCGIVTHEARYDPTSDAPNPTNRMSGQPRSCQRAGSQLRSVIPQNAVRWHPRSRRDHRCRQSASVPASLLVR